MLNSVHINGLAKYALLQVVFQNTESENRFGFPRQYIKLNLEFFLFYSISEAYLEPSRTSTIDFFNENILGLITVISKYTSVFYLNYLRSDGGMMTNDLECRNTCLSN